jgi:hypothetical protein
MKPYLRFPGIRTLCFLSVLGIFSVVVGLFLAIILWSFRLFFRVFEV